MHNAINWFEIPATDFERAKKFYSTIFDFQMPTNVMSGYNMAFFQAEKGIGGSVVQGNGYTPSDTGTLVYLNAGEDLAIILARIDGAGGNVIVPKTLITPQIGYFAIFIDTEGNRIALHSMK
jgi:predicted enzyme related to lactoylglutathione lyase